MHIRPTAGGSPRLMALEVNLGESEDFLPPRISLFSCAPSLMNRALYRVRPLLSLVFLYANHLELTATVDALEELTLGVAEGDLDKRDVIRFFEKDQIK